MTQQFMDAKRAKAHGFTLLEVVIALVILVIIMGVAYGSLSNILSTKKVMDNRRDLRSIVNAVLSRLTKEIQLTSGGQTLLPPRDKQTQPYPARVFVLGEKKTLSNGERGDSITFVARGAGQYLMDGGGNAGFVQITYRAAEDPEQRRGDQPVYVLVRDEVPYSRPVDKAYERTMTFPITDALVGLSFRYLLRDSTEWSEVWGVDKYLDLPSVIEFTIRLRAPDGAIETLTTAVPLPAHAP